MMEMKCGVWGVFIGAGFWVLRSFFGFFNRTVVDVDPCVRKKCVFER